MEFLAGGASATGKAHVSTARDHGPTGQLERDYYHLYLHVLRNAFRSLPAPGPAVPTTCSVEYGCRKSKTIFSGYFRAALI